MLQRGFDDFAGEFSRLADAKAANGIACESDLNGTLGRFFSQALVHTSLDDSEQSLTRLGWLADGGLATPPRHLFLMLFKILHAARCPAQGHLHGIAHALRLCRVLRTLVESHNDVGAE